MDCWGLQQEQEKLFLEQKQVMLGIEKNKVKLLLIAQDASDRTKLNFKKICENKNIPIIEILSMELLSKAIGKPNKVVVGITDINFSKQIEKIIDGGEVIG